MKQTAFICLALGICFKSTLSFALPLILYGNGTAWQIAPLPTFITDQGANYLVSVNCTDNTHCTAVGNYSTLNNPSLPLLLSGSGDNWSMLSTSFIPEDGTDPLLVSVSGAKTS